MAKVTRSDRGNTTPRPRGARATLSTNTPLDTPEDTVATATEATVEDEYGADVNDYADESNESAAYEDDFAGESADDEDESLRLAPRDVAVVSADDLLYTRPGTRVTPHNVIVPAWAKSFWLTNFIAESIIELLKVTWPTRDEAWNMTLVVIAMSALVALVLGVADIGLQHVLIWVVNIGK